MVIRAAEQRVRAEVCLCPNTPRGVWLHTFVGVCVDRSTVLQFVWCEWAAVVVTRRHRAIVVAIVIVAPIFRVDVIID